MPTPSLDHREIVRTALCTFAYSTVLCGRICTRQRGSAAAIKLHRGPISAIKAKMMRKAAGPQRDAEA